MTTLEKVAKLADEISNNPQNADDHMISACLYGLCAFISAGTLSLFAFTTMVKELSDQLGYAIEYVQWINTK